MQSFRLIAIMLILVAMPLMSTPFVVAQDDPTPASIISAETLPSLVEIATYANANAVYIEGALSPDGATVALVNQDEIVLLDVDSDERITQITPQAGFTQRNPLFVDGELAYGVYSIADEGLDFVFAQGYVLADGSINAQYRLAPLDYVPSLALLVSGLGSLIEGYDLVEQSTRYTVNLDDERFPVLYDRDGEIAVLYRVGGAGAYIEIYAATDFEFATPLNRIDLGAAATQFVALSPDGGVLAVARRNPDMTQSVLFLDVASGLRLSDYTIDVSDAFVLPAAFTTDGSAFITLEGTALVGYAVSTGEEVIRLATDIDVASDIAPTLSLSDDGTRLLVTRGTYASVFGLEALDDNSQ